MRIARLFILISCSYFISCSQPKTPEGWLQENTSDLKTETGYDFSAIKKAIGDKRIVALGESTHGSGTYYTLKSELVKYLHEEMGFEVLAMESGLGDAYLGYANIDSLTPIELRDYSVFGNFRTNEANPLFEHIKTTSTSDKPLQYVGFDTQASSEYLFTKLSAILFDYDKELADSLSTRMRSYQRSYGYGNNGDSINYMKHRDIFVATANNTKRYLTDNQSDIISKHDLDKGDFDIMVRSLEMFAASYNLPYEERFRVIAMRDTYMAENLEWFLSEVYPNKKFIVWAHNSHIENDHMEGANVKWMGHFMKEKYEDDYFSIGLFAKSGEVYQYWTEATISIENIDSTYIEHHVMQTEKHTAFLNLDGITESSNTSWLFEPINGNEIENGGTVRFVPKKRFDAIIVVDKSEAPTYD